jgi:hypothetical protein
MAVYTGMASEEPWNFVTTNVQDMINEALEIAFQAVPGSAGVTGPELLIAINDLRHAADELERSLLEKTFGAKRGQQFDDH